MSCIKKCISDICGREYNKDETEYRLGFCSSCGSTLEEKIDIIDPQPSTSPWDIKQVPELDSEDKEPKELDENSSVLIGDILAIDSLGYVHFIEESENREIKANNILKVYINGKVYKSIPIQYDELSIGRNSISFCPDLDLGVIDPEKRISRKHAMVYKEDGKYYVRNLSSKNTLYVNELPVLQNENKEINDQDLILLSDSYIVLKFEQINN